MDYEKAFDKVPHCRLISKLKASHFHDTVIDWVQTYLRDRSQYVEVNGKVSNRFPVTSALPKIMSYFILILSTYLLCFCSPQTHSK